MARAISSLLLCLPLACLSSGAPNGGAPDVDAGTVAADAGTVGADAGTVAADAGAVPRVDAGTSATDAGVSPSTPDAGVAPVPFDGGVVSACSGLDLAGTWSGTFDGNVWWTTDPTNREPVNGEMSFTLTCQGQKFRVLGTMTGSEQHAVRFTAQIEGEVDPDPTPTMNATIAGNVFFTTLGNVPVSFSGTMVGPIVGTRVSDGDWEGMSTNPLVPAAGGGTWEASRR